MRVLWIEDFGEADAESLIRRLFPFANAFEDDELTLLLAEQVRQLKAGRRATGSFWPDLYATGTPIEHEIDVCVTAAQLQAMLAAQPVHDRYDVALVDIDLTKGFFTELPPGVADAARGGFWVFNQLRQQGFGHDRVAFLSANCDTLPDFTAECVARYHLQPIAFGKSEDEAERLGNWLAQTNCEYVRWRRGVLDGVALAEDILRCEGSEAILFNRFVDDHATGFDYDHAQDYLDSLRDVLTAPWVAPAVRHRTCRQFVRTLSHEWEAARPEKLDRNADRLNHAIAWVMKNARNWSAHGKFLHEIGPCELALLFSLNLRAMFALPGESSNPFERQLLSILGENSAQPDVDARLTDAHSRLRSRLDGEIRRGARKRSTKGESSLEPRTSFASIANELAQSTEPLALPYHHLLTQMFWHGLAGRESLEAVLDRQPDWVRQLAEHGFSTSFPEPLRAR